MTEDENGNEWMEGAVPGGLEIAEVMLEVLDEKGWGATWMDCDGLRICPRVRVWLDGYQDLDFEQAFLLRVWTDSDPDPETGRTLTLTDHLAVYRRHVGTEHVDVEWRQNPRLFFDADGEWGIDGLHWWVDVIEEMRRSRAREHRLSDEARDRIAEHNRTIELRDQELARKMRLHLPYLGT